MCRDLTAGGRGAEQPVSHLKGWQRHGEARELGQSQSCLNPLTHSFPAPKHPWEGCWSRSGNRATSLAASVSAEQRALPCPPRPGVLRLSLYFSSMSAPIC